MTPHEIQVSLLNHEIHETKGKAHHVAQQVIDLLEVARQANKHGRTQVVEERLEYSLELLQQLLNNR
jgi:ribosomal protein L17